MNFNTVGNIYDPRRQAFVEWQIEDYFSLSQKADSFVESPIFYFLNASWYLRLFPNGQRSYGSIEWVDLYLICKNCEPNCCEENLSVNYNIGIKSAWTDMTFRSNWRSDCFSWENSISGFSLMKRSELLRNRYEIAPSGVLTIFCNVKHLLNKDAACQTISYDTSSLSRDFQSLLHSGQKSDVVIKVKSHIFNVHKLILGTRSSVFSAMFEHNMKENLSGVVNIADCDPDTFQDFIMFIYTDKIENLSLDNVFKLLALSDKYDVANLKKICMRFMKNNLCLDIACDAMAIADMHNEEELREPAKKLIVDNIKTLLPTDQWISFMRDNPLLAAELLMTVIPSTKR